MVTPSELLMKEDFVARKNTLIYQNITNGDMSGPITSAVTDISNTDNIGIELVFTGTAQGAFYVDSSIDGTTFTAMDFGSPGPLAAGSADSILLNIQQCPYRKIRVRYVPVSGTGTLNAWISTKQIGG